MVLANPKYIIYVGLCYYTIPFSSHSLCQVPIMYKAADQAARVTLSIAHHVLQSSMQQGLVSLQSDSSTRALTDGCTRYPPWSPAF